MTGSLKEFSDLSDAEESSQFNIVGHELQLATQIFGGHAESAKIVAASHPLAGSKNSSALKRKHHSLPVVAPPANVPTFTFSSSDVVLSTSMKCPSSVTRHSSFQTPKKNRAYNCAC